MRKFLNVIFVVLLIIPLVVSFVIVDKVEAITYPSYTDLQYPSSGTSTSENPYDDDAWSTPTNIYSDDAAYANITASSFDTNDYSHVLKASALGFAVPTDGVITGIKVEAEKYHANGDVVDGVVQLTKDGTTRVGSNYADTTTHWGDAAAVTTYGTGTTDLWGTTWTVAEINSANFGVHFVAQAHSNDADAYVDYIRVTVYYYTTTYVYETITSTPAGGVWTAPTTTSVDVLVVSGGGGGGYMGGGGSGGAVVYSGSYAVSPGENVTVAVGAGGAGAANSGGAAYNALSSNLGNTSGYVTLDGQRYDFGGGGYLTEMTNFYNWVNTHPTCVGVGNYGSVVVVAYRTAGTIGNGITCGGSPVNAAWSGSVLSAGYNGNGANGGNSRFGTVQATYVDWGGGGGGGRAISNAASAVGNDGASGGGGGCQNGGGTAGSGGSGLYWYGGVYFHGGTAHATSYSAGGGGGAGGDGYDGTGDGIGATGGPGQDFSSYFGSVYGDGGWFGGGGGGGSNGSVASSGGRGGGGRGWAVSPGYGENGAANTGGGGGGSGWGSPVYAGTGGTGVIVLRYELSYVPIVDTTAATSVTLTEATLNGNIIAVGEGETSDDKRGFVWDTSSHGDPGDVAPASSGYANNNTSTGTYTAGTFSYVATVSENVYYYRAFAHSANGYAYGDEVIFTVSNTTIFTTGATSVTTSSATLYGSLADLGTADHDDCYFEYKNSASSGWSGVSSTTPVVVSDNASFSADVTGLTEGIKYKFRARGNSTYGDAQYFSCVDATGDLYVPVKAQWIYNCYPDGLTSDNTSQSWSASSGNAYDCVDADWKNPDDSDSISASTDGYREIFTFDDYTAGTTISKITVTVRAKRFSILDDVVLVYRYSGSNYDEGNMLSGSTSTGWVESTKTFNTNPVTGVAWTTSNITNMEWGVKKTGLGSTCYVSEMYVTVYPATINNLTTLSNTNNFAYLNVSNLYNLGYCNVSAGNADWYPDRSAAFVPGDFVSWFYLPSISAGETKDYRLNLSVTPVYNSDNTSTGVCHSLPGFALSFADKPLYEPTADSLDANWRGYIDVTDTGYLINKDSSYGIKVSSSGIVQGSVTISASAKTISDNLTAEGLSSGYYWYRLYRSGSTLYLYRNGILIGSTAASGSIDNNANALTLNEYGTVRYCDLAYIKIANAECFNALQRTFISSILSVYNTSVYATDNVTAVETATTISDSALTQSLTDFWKDCTVVFTTGAAAGQTSVITAFTPATDTLTFGTVSPSPSNGDGYYITGRSLTGTMSTSTKVFEMWTEGIIVANNYGGSSSTVGGGNLATQFTKPGAIPNLFATGTGELVPQSSGPGKPLPLHNEIIVPAAAALGVSTQWLWMMIMVIFAVCVALLVFTWTNSVWFTIVALCFCLFAASFTTVLPAWIGLVTAIVGLVALFRGFISG